MTLKKPYSVIKIKPTFGQKKTDEYKDKLQKKLKNKRKK